MSYTVNFSNAVIVVLKKWKKSNPIAFKKVSNIFIELAEHPREGLGHPEPLRGGSNITWSRRVTASDRVIYDILDDIVTVNVLEVEGHYGDK